MQNCLQAVDTPCRLTSQISYTHLKYDSLKGISPFSKEGLRDGCWTEKSSSPIFAGVRDHLRKINMSLLISFDTQATSIAIILSTHLRHLRCFILTNWLPRASAAHMLLNFSPILMVPKLLHSMTFQMSSVGPPLFDAPIARPLSNPWHRQKGRAPRTLQEILTIQSSVRILHTHFCLSNASVKQRKLLRILLHLFLERVLQAHAQDASYNMQETSTHWGRLQKHIVQSPGAYTDGSASKDGTRAGFGVNFSGQPIVIVCHFMEWY
jgi:hypothetical protein